MNESPQIAPSPGRGRIRASMGATLLLLGVAVGVRALEPAPMTLPEDTYSEFPLIPEPMQFLGRGSRNRVAELGQWVSPERRLLWLRTYPIVYELNDCPGLRDWLDTPAGQRTEQLIDKLRLSSPEEALAALALVFQMARATTWDPGFLGRAEHAERLAGLLQEWLRVWAEPSAASPILHEPAMSAALLYGLVMRMAYAAPALGRNREAHERARRFVADLLVTRGTHRTEFGEAFYARFPLAFVRSMAEADFLLSFEQEAIALFPDLNGECPP